MKERQIKRDRERERERETDTKRERIERQTYIKREKRKTERKT